MISSIVLNTVLEIGGRVDHHLHRQAAAGAGQRRQGEGEDLHAGDLAELALHDAAGSASTLRLRSSQGFRIMPEMLLVAGR